MKSSSLPAVPLLLALLAVAACGGTASPTAAPTAIPPTAVAPTEAPPTAAVGADFGPLDEAECVAIQGAVAQQLGVEASLGEGPFQDYIGGGSGTSCLIAASGTGADFPDFFAVASGLQAMLEGQGWEVDMMYAADGPTGTAYGMRKDNRLGLISVMWTVAPDANCPSDKPISECQLKPEQMLYTITLRLAQRR
jgi:hypothetical protein